MSKCFSPDVRMSCVLCDSKRWIEWDCAMVIFIDLLRRRTNKSPLSGQNRYKNASPMYHSNLAAFQSARSTYVHMMLDRKDCRSMTLKWFYNSFSCTSLWFPWLYEKFYRILYEYTHLTSKAQFTIFETVVGLFVDDGKIMGSSNSKNKEMDDVKQLTSNRIALSYTLGILRTYH